MSTSDPSTAPPADPPVEDVPRSRRTRPLVADPFAPRAALEPFPPLPEPPPPAGTPGAAEAGEAVEATDGEPPRRRRTRQAPVRKPAAAPVAAAAAAQEAAPVEAAEKRPRSRRRGSAAPAAPTEATFAEVADALEDEPTAEEIVPDRVEEMVAPEPDAPAGVVEVALGDEAAEERADDDEGEEAEDGEEGQEGEAADGGQRRRRRRRGRRGRGRGGVAAAAPAEDAASEADTAEEPAAAAVATPVGTAAAAGPTRLRARAGRGTQAGRRPTRRMPATVSEETRRSVLAAPPRRMLVTVGEERTQIAVLEERTLVEHYVTQRADASYVGNIYKGRVQNVLPGMEAAFVDIGKGRNGVLYAGEVDYDEADLDGELPRIEQTLKPGQSVLVQVTKDPMGSKGARLTQHLSLAGRYCVLAPGEDMLGISRKLPDDERERLRVILKQIRPEAFGLIVRTAAEEATQEQLEADVERLVERWATVQERIDAAQVLDPVYEEPQLVIRVIRDVFGPEHVELVVDNAELAEQVRTYLGDVAPDLVAKVSVYEGEQPLFDAYEVTTQIRRALEKKIWLRSGGYLIIEKTEAMWVIDVNTGKFVGTDNLEETVLRNNLEAADEIARQLRLRDMGGIIVIDFVDMIVPANRDEVLKRFRRALAHDKTKSRVMEISRLGLVQMTRKNVSHGLQEVFTSRCEVCEGRGRVITDHLLA